MYLMIVMILTTIFTKLTMPMEDGAILNVSGESPIKYVNFDDLFSSLSESPQPSPYKNLMLSPYMQSSRQHETNNIQDTSSKKRLVDQGTSPRKVRRTLNFDVADTNISDNFYQSPEFSYQNNYISNEPIVIQDETNYTLFQAQNYEESNLPAPVFNQCSDSYSHNDEHDNQRELTIITAAHELMQQEKTQSPKFDNQDDENLIKGIIEQRRKDYSKVCCNHQYNTWNNLISHIRKEHEKKNLFVCPYNDCNHSKEQAAYLTEHYATHEKPDFLSCPRCLKSLTHSGNLKQHFMKCSVNKKNNFIIDKLSFKRASNVNHNQIKYDLDVINPSDNYVAQSLVKNTKKKKKSADNKKNCTVASDNTGRSKPQIYTFHTYRPI